MRAISLRIGDQLTGRPEGLIICEIYGYLKQWKYAQSWFNIFENTKKPQINYQSLNNSAKVARI